MPLSEKEIAERYAAGVAAGARIGEMDVDNFGNLLGIVSQNVGKMATEAQKATTAEAKAVLSGIAGIEAAKGKGVDAEAIKAWQNYQDNLTKLQQAGARVDTAVIEAIEQELLTKNPNIDRSSKEYQTEFVRALVAKYGTGTGRPFLFGTMQEAMRRIGADNLSDAEALALFQSAFDAGSEGAMVVQAQELYRNYADQRTAYIGVNTELNNINGVLADVPADPADLKAWYKQNAAQWDRYLHQHEKFYATVGRYLQDENGAFYLNLKETLSQPFAESLAYQQGMLEGLSSGEATSTKDAKTIDFRLARFVQSPGAQRMAEQYGFHLGEIVPVDADTKEAMLKKYPTGVYYEQLGGIYVPGPDDRKAVLFAARHGTGVDPRGDMVQRAIGRHVRTERTFADIQIPSGETTEEPVKGQKSRVSVVNMAKVDGGIVYALRVPGEGKAKYTYVFVANDGSESPMDDSQVSGLRVPEDAWTKVSSSADLTKAKAPKYLIDMQAAWERAPEEDSTKSVPVPSWLRHVEIVPNRLSDPPDSIRYIDPSTGEFRLLLASDVLDMQVVGGGGERQDLRRFIEKVRGLRSERAGEAAAFRSLETASEHPGELAYTDKSADILAEKVAGGAIRGGAPIVQVGEDGVPRLVPLPEPAIAAPDESEVPSAPVAEAKPEVDAPGFRTRSPGMLSPAGENNTGFAAAPVREPPSVEEQRRMTAEYQEKSKAAAPDLYAPLTDEERAARARESLVGGLQEETAPARPGGIGLRASSDKASSNEQQKTDTRVKSIGDFLSGRRRAPRAPAALSARTGGNTGVPNAPVKSNFDKSVLPEAEDLP